MFKGAVRGVTGVIRWRVYNAAGLNNYVVRESVAGRWTLRAQLITSDKFKMSLKPLSFVAPHKKGEWVWPIRDFQIRDGILTAELGPPDPAQDVGKRIHEGGGAVLNVGR